MHIDRVFCPSVTQKCHTYGCKISFGLNDKDLAVFFRWLSVTVLTCTPPV